MAESATREVVLAGDRKLLVFAVPSADRRSATIGLVRPRPDGRAGAPVIRRTRASVKAMAVDGNRLAVHRSDGWVEMRDAQGRLLRSVAAPGMPYRSCAMGKMLES